MDRSYLQVKENNLYSDEEEIKKSEQIYKKISQTFRVLHSKQIQLN